MATRYIYLSDEINKELKEEKNASGLIQKLLLKHFEEKRRLIDPVKFIKDRREAILAELKLNDQACQEIGLEL